MGEWWETAGAPAPQGAASLDELIERLQALRVWSGVSYRELHRRLVRRRRARGIPEEPVFATVYRCFQTGRRRIDIDLVAEIAAELTGDDAQAVAWRHAHTRLERAARPARAHVLGRLPDDLPAFTGRDAELEKILDNAGRGPGIIAIEGMPGVGKTTLAVRAAHAILERDDRIDVILSVNLHGHDPNRSPAEPSAVLDAFLRNLGESGPGVQSLDLPGRSARLRSLLAGRRALVLLDNAADADQIKPFLLDDVDALVIVTSRHRVIRQPVSHRVTLDVLPADQAIELLRARAADVVDSDPEMAARIVDQVGHLPLAIALVAARITSAAGWTLKDHLDQLRERQAALALMPGVEPAFATSYAALPPRMRRMLRRIALHPGLSCDAYAAAALAGVEVGTARRDLAGLVDANLIGSRAAERFELHDLVRIFASSRAREEDAPSARRAALTRLVDYYRSAAAAAMDVYAPEERDRRPQLPASLPEPRPVPDRPAAIAWLEAELPNLLAVGTYAAEHGWPAQVGDLSAILAPYLLRCGHYDEASRLHRAASRTATGSARARALKNLGVIRWHQGAPIEAYETLRRALNVARSAGDQHTEARCLINLGNVRQSQGAYEEAGDLFGRAMEIYRRLGDRTGQSRILMNLGNIHHIADDHQSAIDHQQQALELARSQQNRSTEMQALENLSRLYDELGKYEDAARCAQESLAIAEELGDSVAVAKALTLIGSIQLHRGEPEAAIEHQEGALSIAQAVANVRVELLARLQLGTTLRESGSPGLAASHHRRALEIASAIEAEGHRARALDNLGADYARMGDPLTAEAHWRQALAIYDQLRVPEASRLRSRLSELDASPSNAAHQS